MIAIDTTIISMEEINENRIFKSVSIFMAELLDGFARLHYENEICLIVVPQTEKFVRERFPGYSVFVLDHILLRLAYQISRKKKFGVAVLKRLGIYQKLVEDQRFEVIYFPYALPVYLSELTIPSVITVHDLMIYHNEKKDNAIQKAFSGMIKGASQIVTISDFTRQDVAKEFGVEVNDMAVIPNSIYVDVREQEYIPGLERGYILDINGYGHHKNTLTLVQAFHQIKDSISEDLVLCGAWKHDNYFEEIRDYVQGNGLENRVHMLYQVSEKQRNYLLSHACLFVTPSANEGFGRTPVEAAICKVPVISTKAASLYEATMGMVYYYEDPWNVSALSERMLQCLRVPMDMEERTRIADLFTETYSPERCAQQYWDVFQKVIATSSMDGQTPFVL